MEEAPPCQILKLIMMTLHVLIGFPSFPNRIRCGGLIKILGPNAQISNLALSGNPTRNLRK